MLEDVSTVLLKQLWHRLAPTNRALAWQRLLNVGEAVHRRMQQYDAVVEQSCDRQLELDLPRCHQYIPVMNTNEMRERLRATIKLFILDSGSIYWQVRIVVQENKQQHECSRDKTQ